jgi:tetratricopeptide (TPR) repeat protein/thiol-disulfide isomerase/thioredoxin
VAAALLVSTGLALAHLAAQTTSPPPPAQEAQTSSSSTPAPTPPAARPEQAAFTAAMSLGDPAQRLVALEKIRSDFPEAINLANVDGQILSVLTTWPERTSEMNSVLDRILARIPPSASAEMRLMQTTTAVRLVVTKKLLLDRAERLLSDGLAACSFDKFAESRREAAKLAKRPEPATEVLKREFNSTYRASALEVMGLVYLGQGRTDLAEQTMREAVALAPTRPVTALVDFYKERKNYDAAEAVLKDAIKKATSPALIDTNTNTLADLYLLKGDSKAAESLLKEALAKNPGNSQAALRMARTLETKGDHSAALEYYMTASVGGALRTAADRDAMRALYVRLRGRDAGLEADLDAAYRKSFPNPVTPEHYKPTDKRTDRLVLLEMFTGSGCGPCVSADLAMDAVMERYGDAVVTLAYHANIPAPDPMVVSGGDARRNYYKVSGVPTFNIDGTLGQLGGGARPGTPGVYKNYVAKIDKALETPATAALQVQATSDGDQIKVAVDVTTLPDDVKDLRLHIVLAERMLTFTGENGIRFHPMSVRAVAGEKSAGIPISATGQTSWTFSLAAVREDVTKTLGAELDKRRQSTAASATPREFMADGNAYTAINPDGLVVVAFLQQGAYVAPPRPTPGAATQLRGSAPPPPPGNVLQAAQATVVFSKR